MVMGDAPFTVTPCGVSGMNVRVSAILLVKCVVSVGLALSTFSVNCADVTPSMVTVKG
jgi:hypothetical protein